MGSNSDERIVNRSLHDPEAFAELVDRHGEDLFHYLRRRAPLDAHDLLADVWLAAFHRRHTYRRDLGEVRGWLFGIARNIVLAHLRRCAARPEVEAPDGLEALADTFDWAAIDQRLDRHAVLPAMRAALARLPDTERELLVMVAWNEVTPTQAATALGIPPGTARSRLHRARTSLRKDIEALLAYSDSTEIALPLKSGVTK